MIFGPIKNGSITQIRLKSEQKPSMKFKLRGIFFLGYLFYCLLRNRAESVVAQQVNGIRYTLEPFDGRVLAQKLQIN